MAAAKKHSRKGRRNRFFSFFEGCFGISNKVSATEHGSGKSVKYITTNSGRRGRTLLVNDQKIRNSSKEIREVEDDPSPNKLISNNKVTNSAKWVNKQNSTVQETWANPTNPNSEKWVNKPDSTAQETLTNPTKLSHSVSQPLPYQRKEKPQQPAAGGADKGKHGGEVKVAGEFDSMVGAGIIMVILVVMLIWGKVCAILCTAAWFYTIPRFKGKMDKYYAIKLKYGENNIDLDSWEYKKKVVLQGLLDRNQHI